jgi:hypothetical protein
MMAACHHNSNNARLRVHFHGTNISLYNNLGIFWGANGHMGHKGWKWRVVRRVLGLWEYVVTCVVVRAQQERGA